MKASLAYMYSKKINKFILSFIIQYNRVWIKNLLIRFFEGQATTDEEMKFVSGWKHQLKTVVLILKKERCMI